MILIDAVYINVSGGKVLLELFIKNSFNFPSTEKIFFLFDKRFKCSDEIGLNKLNYLFLDNSESARKTFYKKNYDRLEKVFCFANVPPPINLSNIKVYILFHNTLLLSFVMFKPNEIIKTLKFYIKYLYIRYVNKNEYNWIVQTPSVKTLLIKKLKVKESNIFILPFFEDDWPKKINSQNLLTENNIVYVADGSPQKNHLKLFTAIELLPITLANILNFHFTIPSNFKNVIVKMDQLKNKGYNIYNHGYCNKHELELLYEKCNYLLYPSLTESFGLPLLEGAKAGCKIIASDLPYVYDIINPFEVFNPYDPISISNSLQSALNKNLNSTDELKIKNKITEILNLILC